MTVRDLKRKPGNSPQIFDMFPFFNELELLEIRLNELNDVVDVFVLAEARHTFQKKPKELVFEKHKQRFAEFLPKIRHVVVDDLPGFFYKFRKPTAWDVSDFQKGQVVQGLYDAKPGDILIFSDVDEIPTATGVRVATAQLSQRRNANENGICVFEQRLYAYYLNNICTDYDTHGIDCVAQYNRDGLGRWRGSVMVDFDAFQNLGRSIKKMRLLHDRPDVTVIRDGGWHFTSIGDIERITLKLESYEHSEANTDETKNPAAMRQRILEGKSIFPDNKSQHKIIPLDDTFPEFLLRNQKKFSALIASSL